MAVLLPLQGNTASFHVPKLEIQCWRDRFSGSQGGGTKCLCHVSFGISGDLGMIAYSCGPSLCTNAQQSGPWLDLSTMASRWKVNPSKWWVLMLLQEPSLAPLLLHPPLEGSFLQLKGWHTAS